MRMRRLLYLATLLIVQLALIVKLAPQFAHAFRVDVALVHAPAGWPALMQLVATAAAIVGTSLVLVFPGIALARHRRGGLLRFLGLPRWAVTLATAGAGILVAGTLVLIAAPTLPVDLRLTAVLTARPAIIGGLALAAAGVQCAELLRRSVAPAVAPGTNARKARGRVEVTHPPELRTSAA
jgi:hypothetical protein